MQTIKFSIPTGAIKNAFEFIREVANYKIEINLSEVGDNNYIFSASADDPVEFYYMGCRVQPILKKYYGGLM